MDAVFSVDTEKDLHTLGYEGVKSLPILAELLEKYSIKATFFVTGEVLEKYSKIFQNLKNQGHEIALHSYSHKRYDTLTLEQKEKDIQLMIKAYKKILKTNPKGFRAPQHSIDNQTISLLEKYNFKYDSSKTPGNLMLLRHLPKSLKILANFLSKMQPYKINNTKLIEIPRAAFLLSTGGFELKLYPKITYKMIILLSKLIKTPFVFVIHSWDLINVPGRTNKQCKKEQFFYNLEEFLKYSKQKLNYQTMEKIAEKYNK